jgi:hypothetical protein
MGRRQRKSSRSSLQYILLACSDEEIWGTMPPSATCSLLSHLRTLHLTHSWSCSLGRISPSSWTGVVTPGRMQLTCPVHAVRDLQSPAKRLEQRRRSPLRPFLGYHTVVLFLRDDAFMSPSWLFGWVFLETHVAAAANSRTLIRCVRDPPAAVTPQNRASLRPPVL